MNPIYKSLEDIRNHGRKESNSNLQKPDNSLSLLITATSSDILETEKILCFDQLHKFNKQSVLTDCMYQTDKNTAQHNQQQATQIAANIIDPISTPNSLEAIQETAYL